MPERKVYLALNLVWLLLIAVGIFHGPWWLAAVAALSWIPVFDRSRSAPYLPSLMYHCVSDNYHRFPKSQLCVSLRNFRWAMRWLKLRGYRTLSFAEAEQFTKGEIQDRRIIHLTFDDGYLDNWVNVHPVLEEHGFTGTVFVTDDFIARGGSIRPQRRVGQHDAEEEWGFMNEAEIRQADASGVLEFLPHGKTHTWYPKSDRLAGLHLPGDRQVWLDWNLKPERKADWITDFPQGFAGEGWPILEFGKSLEVRVFRAEEKQLAAFRDEVRVAGMPRDPERINSLWQNFRHRHPEIGRMETEEEFSQRIREELGSTKRYLEGLLGKPCPYFCWPGGGKQEFSLQVAYRELGYRMTTTHQYGTPNRRGVPSRWLYRIAPGYSLSIEHPSWNLLRFISQVETTRRNYCWISIFAFGHAMERLFKALGRNKRPRDVELTPVGIPLH